MRERAIACGADPSKIEIVPNGIEISEIGLALSHSSYIERNFASTEPDVFKIVFIGSLTKVKGIDVLLDAAKTLKRNGICFRLRVIGSGPLRSELEGFVELNDMKSMVSFYGNMPRVNLAKIYRWADVTCVPSISDLLPTVALESLAAGTPVVGSAVGGIPFIVQSEINGLLVPPVDSDALASALAQLSSQPVMLRRLKEASVASVLPRYSWERNGKSLIEAICKSLARG
jgi:glycosyltransferase involved in cell wall biosynthesis